MTKQVIPLALCRYKQLYRLRSRNLSYGVFDGSTGFVGIREKFESRYLFTEYHQDTGPPFGTVRPLEVLEECPIEDLRETLDSVCGRCNQPTTFVEWTDLDRPEGAYVGKGRWICCADPFPTAPLNHLLFNWLDEREKFYDDLVRCVNCSHLDEWHDPDGSCFNGWGDSKCRCIAYVAPSSKA
jgi:hypothetical protein